jgi:Domain of unknown function (DUF4296)
MMRIFIFFAGLVLISSCNNKNNVPADVLKPDKMQAVLWDVIKADIFTAEFIKKDSSKNAATENLKLQQQIFAIHKISKADFYRSYDYYKSNTELFKKVMDSMVLHAERNRYEKPAAVTPLIPAVE